ncbi:unnamed protein product [Phytophthora fragariaefolia]|uniref:Unnamed protein product n=1 Tax=Phytophthora fragariaefolia TaxID=1490495 RepID=A0A9W6XZU5_9STRA|nr:unnamed protein product [Phytophthora fragariaefolia]
MPAAFATFLEELGALQLAIPPPPAASGSSEGSGPTPPASSGSFSGAAGTSGTSTSLTVDSDTSDDSGPVIPTSLHKGKGKRAAKSSVKLRSAPPPPSVPSSLPAASVPPSSAPISGIAVSADSDVLSFTSIPSGSDPPFSPIPRPQHPQRRRRHQLPHFQVRRWCQGVLPPVPKLRYRLSLTTMEVSGQTEPLPKLLLPPGGVFSSPVVSQPRRDGRPTRAASTTAGLRSMVAAENEAAPDALVLGLATPSRMPAAAQASVARSASVPDPAESAAVVAAALAAVVTSASARRRVANTHTDPVPPARVVATPTPRQASASRARTVVTTTLSTMPGTRSTAFEPVTAIPAPTQGPQPRVRASRKLPDLANPLLEPAFTAPGAQEAWCEILNARIPQPIASDQVTECSIAGIQAFADWEDPLHPWQRLRARLPESPCTFGADDFMPDKPISIRASGLAIVVKLWRQFTGRAVGRTEHSDLGFALWERAHWISVAAVEQWLQQLSDRIGSDTPEYLETEAAWRAYNKARNLCADRLRLQIPKRFWVWCTPDASGKIKCPPEILLEPSMLQYSLETLTWAPVLRLGLPKLWIWMPGSLGETAGWGSTREEVGAAIVVNPGLRQSHVTAPWVQEFSDAQAQAAADASAAADSPSDASSARTPIPAADQASVQAELGTTAPAQARLDVLVDLATTTEIKFRSVILLILHLFSNHIPPVQRFNIVSSFHVNFHSQFTLSNPYPKFRSHHIQT